MSHSSSTQLKHKISVLTYRALLWGRDHVPPGIRSIVGVLFMVGGVFGFLPILGFWMLPLGIAFIALDLPLTRHRIEDWMERLKERIDKNPPPNTQRDPH